MSVRCAPGTHSAAVAALPGGLLLGAAVGAHHQDVHRLPGGSAGAVGPVVESVEDPVDRGHLAGQVGLHGEQGDQRAPGDDQQQRSAGRP